MRTASIASLTISVLGLCLAVLACGRGSANAAGDNSCWSDDEKHRLYAAALAASDSPLDSEIFKCVCRQIEIFDAGGKPNDKYMTFVSAHVDWATNRQTEQFRNEINTPAKARQYIKQRLAGCPQIEAAACHSLISITFTPRKQVWL